MRAFCVAVALCLSAALVSASTAAPTAQPTANPWNSNQCPPTATAEVVTNSAPVSGTPTLTRYALNFRLHKAGYLPAVDVYRYAANPNGWVVSLLDNSTTVLANATSVGDIATNDWYRFYFPNPALLAAGDYFVVMYNPAAGNTVTVATATGFVATTANTSAILFLGSYGGATLSDALAPEAGIFFIAPIYSACLVTPGPSATPTSAPSFAPSAAPSAAPTQGPSAQPTQGPTFAPSAAPTQGPTAQPSHAPTNLPSSVPSVGPSSQPSLAPTNLPSIAPTVGPSSQPSIAPSAAPSSAPSIGPSSQPSLSPSAAPSSVPSIGPSAQPSIGPSAAPSQAPSAIPTFAPTQVPTAAAGTPTATPSAKPTVAPTAPPTQQPTTAGSPTETPTLAPSNAPTAAPTAITYPVNSQGVYNVTVDQNNPTQANVELKDVLGSSTIAASFTFPANFVGAGGSIEIAALTDNTRAAPSGRAYTGIQFSLNADYPNFTSPVVVKVSVAGIANPVLMLSEDGNSTWSLAADSCSSPSADVSNNYLSVNICHFTDFAVFSSASSSSSDDDSLKLGLGLGLGLGGGLILLVGIFLVWRAQQNKGSKVNDVAMTSSTATAK